MKKNEPDNNNKDELIESEGENEEESSSTSTSSSSSSSSSEGLLKISIKYFEKEWLRKEISFRNDDKIKDLFVHSAKTLRTFLRLNDEIENEEEREKLNLRISHLCRNAIPGCISSILTRKKWIKEQRKCASLFIRTCIDFCLTFIDEPSYQPNICQTLFRIFDHSEKSSPFYYLYKSSKEEIDDEIRINYLDIQQSSDQNDVNEDENKEKDIEGFCKPLKNHCLYLFIHLNHFTYYKNGFNKILSLIKYEKNEDKMLNIQRLKMILKVIDSLKNYMNQSYMKKRLNDINILKLIRNILLKNICAKIRSFKREDYVHYDEVRFKYIPSILSIIYQQEDKIHQYMLKLYIDISAKMSEIENLESKLQSLRDIKSILDRIKKKEKLFNKFSLFNKQEQESSQNNNSEKFEFKIDEHELYLLLKRYDFLERYMSMISYHAEIFRQGLFLFILYTKEGDFNKEHIDKIWKISLTLHEHDKMVIYTSLSTLSLYFKDYQLIEYILFDKIKNMNQLYDNQTIDLIYDIVQIMIKKDLNKKWDGLDMLWDITMNNNNINVVKRSFEKIGNILSNESSYSQHRKYIDNCCMNIKNHTHVILSMNLLKEMISKSKRKKKLIHDMESSHQLLSIIMDDFKHYKKSIKKKFNDDDNDMNQNSSDKDKYLDYMDEIRYRLDFISFILSNSSLSLSIDHLNRLWDLTITKSLSEEEREVSYRWWRNAVKINYPICDEDGEEMNNDENNSFVLNETTSIDLFKLKIIESDPKQLTFSGYQLFERFFISMNDKNGKIVRKVIEKDNDDNSDDDRKKKKVIMSITSNDLIGIEYLYRIALETSVDDILKSSMNLIVSLYSNLELFNSKNQSNKIREDFMVKIMNILNDSIENKKEYIIMRCLMILKRMRNNNKYDENEMNQNKKDKDNEIETYYRRKEQYYRFSNHKIVLKYQGHNPRRLSVPADVPIRVIKEKAIELFDINESIDNVYFIVDDDKSKEIWNNDRPLGFYQLNEESTFTVKISQNSIRISNNSNFSDHNVYGWILSSLILGYKGLGLDHYYYESLISKKLNLNSSSKLNGWINIFKQSQEKKDDNYNNNNISINDNDDLKQIKRYTYDPRNQDEMILMKIMYENDNYQFNRLYNLLEKKKFDNNDQYRIAYEIYDFFIHYLPLNKDIIDKMKSFKTLKELKSFIKQKNNENNKILFLYHLRMIEGMIYINYNQYNDDDINDLSLINNKKKKTKSNVNNNNQDQNQTSSNNIISPLFTSTDTFKYFIQLIIKLDQSQLSNINYNDHKEINIEIIDSLLNIIHLYIFDNESKLISTDYLKAITDNGSIESFIYKLLDFIAISSSHNNHYLSYDIIQLSLDMITSICIHLKSFKLLFKYKDIHKLIIQCICSNNDKIRSLMKDRLISLMKYKQSNVKYIYDICYPIVINSNEGNNSLYDSFFDVIVHSIGSINNDDKISLPLDKLLDNITEKLLNITESSIPDDSILIGYMRIIDSLIKKDPSFKDKSNHLIDFLFNKCLFISLPNRNQKDENEINDDDKDNDDDDNSSSFPLFKSHDIRYTTYQLLNELSYECDINYESLLFFLNRLIKSIRIGNIRRYGPLSFPKYRNQRKNSCGYIGLKNQGATCYMNASIQQLFMVQEFRQSILNAETVLMDGTVYNGQKLNDNNDNSSSSPSNDVNESSLSFNKDKDDSFTSNILLDESILFQLQKLFAFLQEGQQRYFDTKKFCQSYKGFDGLPVDTSQQMDANEFLNRLFENLENELKRSENNTNVMKKIFGGSLCNQIIPTECEHRKETIEDYYTISLEIKNKNNIYDSLSLFIEGEILTGDNKYFCDLCQKPVEIRKRYCINSLPQYLILHLKRFEFNYETMRQEKINSLCSFPKKLDLKKYMRETLLKEEFNEINEEVLNERINEYYEYDLTGIVVHSGSCNGGHYYSFIKDYTNTKEEKWYTFNDQNVYPFNHEKIPVECFGGTYETEEYDSQKQQRRKVIRERSNNAYMLIYKRTSEYDRIMAKMKKDDDKQSSNNDVSVDDDEKVNNSNSSLLKDNNNDDSSSSIVTSSSSIPSKASIPPHIMKLIQKENRDFLLKSFIFDDTFESFIWRFINIKTPKGLVGMLNKSWSIKHFISIIDEDEKRRAKERRAKAERQKEMSNNKGSSDKKKNKQDNNENKSNKDTNDSNNDNNSGRVKKKKKIVDPFESLPCKISETDELLEIWKNYAIKNVNNINPNHIHIRIIQFLLHYLFKISIEAHPRSKVKIITFILQSIISSNIDSCKWILNFFIQHNETTIKYLTRSSYQFIRLSYAQVIASALFTLADHEREYFIDHYKVTIKENHSDPPKSYVTWFIEFLLIIWKYSLRQNSDAYIALLKLFYRNGKEETKLLNKKGIIHFFKVFDSIE